MVFLDMGKSLGSAQVCKVIESAMMFTIGIVCIYRCWGVKLYIGKFFSSRIRRAFAVAGAIALAGCATHPTGSAEHSAAPSTMTRAQLNTEFDAAVKRLNISALTLDRAAGVMVCPAISSTTATECLLREGDTWRAYYRLQLPRSAQVNAAQPQTLVYVLHSSRAFSGLLHSEIWTQQQERKLGTKDLSVLLITPEQVVAQRRISGVNLTRVHL